MDYSLKTSSRAKELHRTKRDIGWYKERRLAAESGIAQAEYELSNANKEVKDLSSMIVESSYKEKAHMQDIASLEKLGKVSRNGEYSQVMRELEHVKQQLFQLKLDVNAALEEKSRAEKEIEASRSSMLYCSRTAESLREEIEEANEEQLLLELARIDALKELGDVKAQREKEANEFSFELEKIRKKLKKATEEIDKSKELEMKLATTMSDVEFLRNELKVVKEMEKMVQRHESMDRTKWEESRDDSSVLETIKEKIEAAKEDLTLIREKGFQFMESMDVIRKEMKCVNAETAELKKEESKSDSKVQNLKSKILRAKSKLEGLTAAEEKATSIVINSLETYDTLNAEIEAAKKERELVNHEVTTAKAEIKQAEFEKGMAEERLQGVMQELRSIKLSESLALEKLKSLTENAIRQRGLATENRSQITISKFEFEYLTNRSATAKEIADKKVAAAKAWLEAVKTSEREILIRTKIAESEIKETKLDVYSKEKLENWPKRNASRDLQRSTSQNRKSIKSNGSLTPSRGSKFQRPASPASRNLSPFIIKKKKKVIPDLAKFFRGKKNKRNDRTS